MSARRFQRNTEDFVCAVCGTEVSGNGYTNHCPDCLWSLHVDKNPGDRAAGCSGRMAPIALSIRHGEKSIIHRCEKCGCEKRNKAGPDDNEAALLKLPVVGPHYGKKKESH